ncbi:MAG: hypothetical protein HY680_05590 [Chloroflexi bacterium]|nr:hypothetical protein [Chloroflexota bacterium]
MPQIGEHDGQPWETRPIWEVLRGDRLSRVEDPETALRSLLLALPRDAQQPGDWQAVGWVARAWQPPQVEGKPARGAGVSTFARRLIAQERRRVQRSSFRGPPDRRARRSPRRA